MKAMRQYLLMILSVLLLFSGCANGQLIAEKNSKVLIVYLTRTKNTLAVAQMIQKHTDGKLVGLELEKPYPENYGEHVAQVARENSSNFLPPLKTKIDSIDIFDTIFIGFPTWGMKIPPPIKTFLTQHNLSGKTVVPFNTNAGYGVATGLKS